MVSVEGGTTMKKIVRSASLVIAGLIAGVMVIPALANTPLFSETTDKQILSEQEAIDIALNNTVETFEVVKVELDDDDDDDTLEYELLLRNDLMKVEVEIDAYTGEIQEWEVELITSNQQSQSTMISLEQAKEIALNKAGSGYVVVSIELENDDDDDDDQEYELELRSDRFKVEVEIDAYTGQIMKWEAEAFKTTSIATIISIERATEIALNEAGTGFEVMEVEFDDDDTPEYEVKLRSSTQEMEVEINATTGEIIKWEIETFKTTSTDETSTIISRERAIEIALNKAGTGFEVMEVEFDDDDDDDDTPEYEVKLRSSTQEMVVEINATTGEIIKWEIETYESTSDNSTSTMITEERAIEIARAKIGLSPALEEIELEDDDNRMVYELEFEENDKGYEFEIDAYTGQILEFEIDD